jgi:hypothetical protein
VSLPSSYRSRRGHIHLLRVLPLVGCRSKTPTPGAEDEGVAAVEGDGWLDEDGSHRVRHMIFGENPYLARQLSVF